MDLWLDNNIGWNSTLIKKICSEDSARAILNIEWPFSTNEDQLFWCGNMFGAFKVSNCFAINYQNTAVDQGILKTFWSSKLHERLKIFLWRVLSNTLPTIDVLSKRFDRFDNCCVVSGESEESCLYLFKDCNGLRGLAFRCSWGGKSDAWQITNITELIDFCINPPNWVCKGESAKAKHSAFMASLFYCFWGFRMNACMKASILC